MTLGILYSGHKAENYNLVLIQLSALWKMSVSAIEHEVF